MTRLALFGIVNTLTLSVYERPPELGLLRAIRTSRRQVRRVVRLEAVITSLIGAVLGVVRGVLFALLISPARRAARLDVLRALAYQ